MITTGLTDDLNLKIFTKSYLSVKGLNTYNQELYIEDATDLLYMNQLFEVSNMFRSANYKVIRDIDMHQFHLMLISKQHLDLVGILVHHLFQMNLFYMKENENQNGNINYHSIIGLTITSASYVGQFAIVFLALFWKGRTLKFYRFENYHS